MLPVVLLILAGAAAPPERWVGRFAATGSPPRPWTMMTARGKVPTLYHVAEIGGRSALEADYNSSMSLLVRPVSIDFAKTPVLCWRWYVESPVERADMTRNGRSDFAARLYVGFDMPASALSAMTRLKLQLARTLYDQ